MFTILYACTQKSGFFTLQNMIIEIGLLLPFVPPAVHGFHFGSVG